MRIIPISLIKRISVYSAAVILLFFSFSLMFSLITDPGNEITLSEKRYFTVDYSDTNGFTLTPLCEPELLTGYGAEAVANIIQAGNFIITSVKSPVPFRGCKNFNELYSRIIPARFNPEKTIYLTTGEPHSRAYYLRNPGVFYRDFLNPETAVSKDDYINRMKIAISGTALMLRLFQGNEFTTTAVPAGGRYFAAVNYNDEPSDSILGMLSTLESLVFPGDYRCAESYIRVRTGGSYAGRRLLAAYTEDLRIKIKGSLQRLQPVKIGYETFLIPDSVSPMSASTDVRDEPQRFIVSANYYAMLKKGVRLGIISDHDIREITGMTLREYKLSILKLFGGEGYIRNSAREGLTDSSDPALNIVLDFVHVKSGFWELENRDEFMLFKKTADIILNDSRFYDEMIRCIKMSIKNPPVPLLHEITAPEYQGSVVWPFYNSEFASKLLLLYGGTGDLIYLEKAGLILDYIKKKAVESGGYPEVLEPGGRLYRTCIYRSALADSWLPGFLAVLKEYEAIKKR